MSKYKKNKKLLIKLLGSVSLPPDLTDKERKIQIKKGILPNTYNCHHILPVSMGRDDSINNLSIIKITDHEKLHDSLDHILLAQPEGFTREDIPYLKTWTKHHGGFTLDDIKKGNEVTLYAS